MHFQWDPRTWRKIRWGLYIIRLIIAVHLRALEAWVQERRWRKRTATQTTDSTGSKTTTVEEVSLAGDTEIPEASPSHSPTPLSSEQRRTLDWVRLGSHDDSSCTFEYAQDHFRLEAAVPDRPQSEGSEPRQPGVEVLVEEESSTTNPEGNDQAGSPIKNHTTQEVDDTEVGETPDEDVHSEGDGEEARPDSIERPSTSLSFHPEDDQQEDDDDREVAVTSPTIDITKEYQLPKPNSDVISEEAEVADSAPEAEVAVEEHVEVIPVIERATDKPPCRQQRLDTLSRDKRNELMELRSKLKLLQALREREKGKSRQDTQEQEATGSDEPSELSEARRAELMELRSKLQLLQELRGREKRESRHDTASSSTTTAASPQQEQEEAASSEDLSALSEEKRAELMELRRKLVLLVKMRELEQAPESAPVESSVPVSTVKEEEREEVEEDELSNDTNLELSMSQSHEPTDSDPETVDNDDEIPPPPEEVPEEEEYYNDDDGLIDPFSSDADEPMNFVKAWLLLPGDLSALEVLYQVANLRDTLTFVPGWVPTKDSLVRADESLLVRSQPVPYEINWHFLARLRSLRWRTLLETGAAVVGAADRAWLEGFLDEMEAPTFALGGPREQHRQRRSRSKSLGTSTATAADGRGGLHRRRSTLHQVEAAAPPLPHEEEAVRATNQTLWTRHALEAATAALQAILDNTEERTAWIDDRTVEVLAGLEEMEQSLLRLLDNLAGLDADVGAAVEGHGQEYAHMAGRIQLGLP
ncbi:hypothetical protein PG984_000996 [Apiospora sp. TS-2023a]